MSDEGGAHFAPASVSTTVDGLTAEASDASFVRWAQAASPRLRRKAFLLCGDWHGADDLLQESMIAMFLAWPRVCLDRNVDGYAARVVMNKFFDSRRPCWSKEQPSDALPDRPDDRAKRPFDVVDAYDARVATALQSLPSDHRAVVVLRFEDDLSVPEIAALLNVPEGTVKSRLSRASASLRGRLQLADQSSGERFSRPSEGME